MHLFITGEVGVGKSTLIKHLLEQVPQENVYGFYTKKIASADQKQVSDKIYMYSAHETSGEGHMHCVAEILGKGQFNLHVEAFEEYGVSLLGDIPKGSIVVMDELGFLESQAPQFCKKVLEVLDTDVIAVGVIKAKHTPFLEQVKQHPFVKLYTISAENRNELTARLIEQLREERDARSITGKNV